MAVSPAQFIESAAQIVSFRNVRLLFDQTFRSLFGITPDVTSTARDLVLQNIPLDWMPEQLFWALIFSKGYCTEKFNWALLQLDPETVQKWFLF